MLRYSFPLIIILYHTGLLNSRSHTRKIFSAKWTATGIVDGYWTLYATIFLNNSGVGVYASEVGEAFVLNSMCSIFFFFFFFFFFS